MSFYYIPLASGSQGNAMLIYDNYRCFLVDCGISVSALEKKLKETGFHLSQVQALFLTHEHSDHMGGIKRLSRFVPIYMSRLLYPYVYEKIDCTEKCFFFSSDEPFLWNNICVNPISVPHDCVDPVAFTFDNGRDKIGLMTDVGHVTQKILMAFSACSTLLLESNYDWDMLEQSSRPFYLKKRVAGSLGHLSNQEMVYFLKKVDRSFLKQVSLLHVSQDCNCMDLVFKLALKALGGNHYCGGLEIIQQSGVPYHLRLEAH